MVTDIYQHIQQGLTTKRDNITDFLESATEAEKDTCCCEDEEGVQTHLQVIETALERVEDQSLGLCEVCHGYVDSSLLEMDYTSSVCLDHYSDEERRRLEAELELSQIVQRALLPQRMPAIAGVELAAFSRPSEIIGGDYFDFFQYRDGSYGFVIADVSGHGVSAGMLMSSLQTALRTMAPGSDSPAEILERINHFYIHNINFTTFVTVFLARYDPATRALTYVNSGHNPPAVFRKRERAVVWLVRTAAAIGLMEEFHPQTETVVLSDGDALLLYTDGVTETHNSKAEQFGEERLAGLLLQNADLSAPNLIQVLRTALVEFSNGQPLADDTTVIALRVSNGA